MTEWQHLLLLPGLLCDDRLWQPQVDAPSEIAEIVIADMTRDDTLAGMPACRHGRSMRCRGISRSQGCRWGAMPRLKSCARRRNG